MERLESLERLQRLERLESLQRLQRDYAEVSIPSNSVIYCDPPYKDTFGYRVEFDHERFYDWCRRSKAPVYISEYTMPEDFICIATFVKASGVSGQGAKLTEEKLFVPRHQYTPNKGCRQLLLF